MCRSKKMYIIEPPRDKTNKVSVHPAKTQISLGNCPVCLESLLCTHWVAKDPKFLHADSKDSDQTGRMPRLIFRWVLNHIVGFVMRWLNYCLRVYIYSLCKEDAFIPLATCLLPSVTALNNCQVIIIVPHHEKTCLRDLRPGKTRSGLLS